jgi:hypothetical protein
MDFAATATVVCTLGLSLWLPAVREGLPAGPFELSEQRGYSCAIFGWTWSLLAWLPNPFLLVGIILLGYGRRWSAAFAGTLALFFLVVWRVMYAKPGLVKGLLVGYELWVASMVLLTSTGYILAIYAVAKLSREIQEVPAGACGAERGPAPSRGNGD